MDNFPQICRNLTPNICENQTSFSHNYQLSIKFTQEFNMKTDYNALKNKPPNPNPLPTNSRPQQIISKDY